MYLYPIPYSSTLLASMVTFKSDYKFKDQLCIVYRTIAQCLSGSLYLIQEPGLIQACKVPMVTHLYYAMHCIGKKNDVFFSIQYLIMVLIYSVFGISVSASPSSQGLITIVYMHTLSLHPVGFDEPVLVATSNEISFKNVNERLQTHILLTNDPSEMV